MSNATAIKIEKEYAVMTFEQDARKECIPDIKKNVEETATCNGCRAFLIDLSKVKTMDEPTMVELVVSSKRLKEGGIKLYVVKANSMIQTRIVNGGLNNSLRLSENVDEALSDAGIKAHSNYKIDVTVINPFIEGAVKTLKVQAKLESTPGLPFIKGQGISIAVDIVATLGIISPKFNGTIALCFPKSLFLHIVNDMLGETYTELTEENSDAAGELLNIIFGAAKEVLNASGYGIQPSIPTVIYGDSLQLKNIMPDPTVVLPMSTPQGRYEIHVGFIKKN